MSVIVFHPSVQPTNFLAQGLLSTDRGHTVLNRMDVKDKAFIEVNKLFLMRR